MRRVLGGLGCFAQFPDVATIHAGRADIKRPFGRHQCGLRNTLRNCLLMDRLEGLWPPSQEVLEKLSGMSYRLVTSLDICVCGHRGPLYREPSRLSCREDSIGVHGPHHQQTGREVLF
jgi:hypothetical protein